jgi:hypothetical protein
MVAEAGRSRPHSNVSKSSESGGERARVDKLLAEADAWKRADVLRGDIAALEQLAVARQVSTDAETELAASLKWAREQADKLDPVRGTLDRLTRAPTGLA